MSEMRFEVVASGPTGRAGVLSLPHGDVPTPAFMPVATRGTVKAVDTEDLRELGADIVLGNAYHLWRAPGVEALEAAGGLHAFMGWSRPILTDSGGFQAVSLARAGTARVEEAGVRFDDGGLLTPEAAVELQQRMGADIAMALDQPLDFPAGVDAQLEATARTHRWAERCRAAWDPRQGALFGIVQGGFDAALRRESAAAIRALDFPGYGIGGLSMKEPPEVMAPLLEAAVAGLEPHKPRYLMGVGSGPELVASVASGVDLFDCVWPTRLARTGTVLVAGGRYNLLNTRFAEDAAPLEEGCDCPACRRHSRAGARYMFQRGELLGLRLLTLHNLHHLLALLRGLRATIMAGAAAGVGGDAPGL